MAAIRVMKNRNLNTYSLSREEEKEQEDEEEEEKDEGEYKDAAATTTFIAWLTLDFDGAFLMSTNLKLASSSLKSFKEECSAQLMQPLYQISCLQCTCKSQYLSAKVATFQSNLRTGPCQVSIVIFAS